MRRVQLGWVCAVLTASVGCTSGDGPSTGLPYDVDTTVVIRPDGSTTSYPTPNGDACLPIGTPCIRPQVACGDDAARADVVIDGAGALVYVVCYPIEDDGSLVRVDDASTVATEPGDVVVLDRRDDGADIVGDVDLNGMNTVVYGHEPGTSVIRGDVTLAGGSTVIRGVRIEGNLTLSAGGAAAVFVEVTGDVVVSGNGQLLVGSVVHGTVRYSGAGFEFVGNALANGVVASASLATCSDNQTFTDLDEDLVLDRATELTGPLACP